MFDRPQAGNDCIIVNIQLHGEDSYPGEFLELVKSTQASVVGSLSVNIRNPHPRYFLGTGKAEEVAELVKNEKSDLVIIDHASVSYTHLTLPTTPYV